MNLLDRFSTHLRDVLSRAIALASELKNPKVEPVHLLAALSNQTGSVGAELIERFRLNNSALHKALKSLPASSPLTQPTLPGSIAAGVLTPLSGSSKSALEQTLQVAHQSGHSYVGTEHLLFALISLSNDQINNVLKKTGLTAAELNKQIDIALANASHFPQIAEMVDVAERLNENLNDTSIEPMPLKSELPKRVSKKDSALDFFATNLTTEEAQKNIDPVIGRTTEIDRLIQILCRRTKNNPLLLGEPGVGKTAIAEGLAKKILAGNVPEVLMRKKIYALDMGLLIAGTMYRGEFEGRLRSVIEEVSQNQDIVLFIDEIHNIIGAGSNQGTMDAANILKPALARGLIRCIGATTPGEYKKYIEQDAALERRFQPINVKEPSIQATKKILAGIKGNYESYHGVVITPGAIDAAVRLSTRYLAKAHLPDKAIDLLDETAAAKKTKIKKSELAKKLWQTELELERIIVNKELAAQEDRFKDAVKSKATEKKLRSQIKKLQLKVSKQKVKPGGTITAKDVAVQLGKIIGTPPSDLLTSGNTTLSTLATNLKKKIIGQDQVINEVCALVRQAQLGLSNPERPLASFMFVGKSGVGKTELAKQLANELYHNSDALIKLDMSEFSEGFSSSKLLGSPAGYVGYKESNQFTDKVKLNPYSIVLFDEVDKAHKDVVKLLLQMLENGEVTDGSGKKISLKHAIIILTTTIGSDVLERGAMGFGGLSKKIPDTHNKATEVLKEYFSKEIINRLDAVNLFNPLGENELAKIAAMEMNSFNTRLAYYRTSISADNKTLLTLVRALPKGAMGAREVRRELRARVESLLSDIILSKNIKDSYKLTAKGKVLEVN